MIAIDGLLGILILGFWLWALLDCIFTPRESVRNLPKLLWVALIVLLWVFGALGWVLFGRTPRDRRTARGERGEMAIEPARRPSRLDDLPVESAPAAPQHITDARSAELDAQIAAWEAEQARKGDAAPE
ncbi:MAG: PLD nuclease N-terminal domain-containing protein [Acidimicrobiia bacterium]